MSHRTTSMRVLEYVPTRRLEDTVNKAPTSVRPQSAGQTVECEECSRAFVPRFGVQTHQKNTTDSESTDSTTQYFCSQRCRNTVLLKDVECSQCSTRFVPTLALHIVDSTDGRKYFCSDDCRGDGIGADKNAEELPQVGQSNVPAKVVAVLNQKGGTGKTTTAVNVAAGLARRGHRTLLVDLDAQGNVSVSLGLTTPRGIHHALLGRAPIQNCIIQTRENLDVITADEGLAAAEIQLARGQGKDRTHRLLEVMAGIRGYEYVVLDCAPALSVLNHNALVYADEVLIPVSCDYLALVGVKQVLRSLRRVGEQTGTQIRIAGVLPTFYNSRNRICGEVLGYLRKSFGARTLPPVRVNTKLAEAPSHKRTIFEHAEDSNGARDYVRVVEWIVNGQSTAITEAA